MELDKRTLFHFSIFTLLGMVSVGILIIYFFSDQYVFEVLLKGKFVPTQIAAGLGVGMLLCVVVWFGLNKVTPEDISLRFQEITKQIDPSYPEIILYSACAAIGEEVLFRGALQPLIGLWPATIIFVGLHGYIRLGGWKNIVFSAGILLICSAFGYLFHYLGLFAAIAAHFIYDCMMFAFLKRQKKVEVPEKTTS